VEIDIKTGMEYLFIHPGTGEAFIMKVEQDIDWRARHTPTFRSKNFIQREGTPWEEVTVDGFNSLGLNMIGEYNPEPEINYDYALESLRKTAIEIGCDQFEVNGVDWDDLSSVIGERLSALVEASEPICNHVEKVFKQVSV